MAQQFASVSDYLNANKDYTANTLPGQAVTQANTAAQNLNNQIDTGAAQFDASANAGFNQGTHTDTNPNSAADLQALRDYANQENAAHSHGRGVTAWDPNSDQHYQDLMKKYNSDTDTTRKAYSYSGPSVVNFGVNTALNNPYASGSTFGGGGGGILDKALFATNPNAQSAVNSAYSNAQNNVNDYFNQAAARSQRNVDYYKKTAAENPF